MTKIENPARHTRRPGVVGVHSVDGFSFDVPDLLVAKTFYEAFGLDVREEHNGLGLYTIGQAHCWGRVQEGKAKRFGHLSFGAFADDMEQFRARLQQHGVRQVDPPRGSESNGIWFHDPDGTLVEIKTATKTSPDEKAIVSNPSPPPGVQGACFRSAAPIVRPRRFGHILIYTADVIRALGFYEAIFGLRLSDRAEDGIAFMHGVHGSDHHMVAFGKSNGPGLHHLSWDVGSINDVGLGAMQMAERGFSAGWGLGRHVQGSNCFHYVRDPWGSYCEYSADMDYVPADHDWPSGNRAPHDGFYLWGPVPPEDFTFNYETAS